MPLIAHPGASSAFDGVSAIDELAEKCGIDRSIFAS